MEQLSVLIMIIGALTLCVNVITQVFKKTFGWKKDIPTQIICLILSIVLTLIAMVVYCQIKGITILWYYWVGSVICGFFVSYSAMFGFDTLKDVNNQYIK